MSIPLADHLEGSGLLPWVLRQNRQLEHTLPANLEAAKTPAGSLQQHTDDLIEMLSTHMLGCLGSCTLTCSVIVALRKDSAAYVRY